MALADNSYVECGDLSLSTSYKEFFQSGDARFSQDNTEATRVFLTRWTGHETFLEYLFGYSFMSGVQLKRILPEKHPRYSVSGNDVLAGRALFAVEATVTGLGEPLQSASQGIQFDIAKITTTYRALPYNVYTDATTGSDEKQRYVIRTYNYLSEYLSTSGRMMFVTGKNIVPQAPGRISSAIEKTMTWLQIPAGLSVTDINVPTYDTIQSLKGKVNSVTFDGDAPGTVLYLGLDAQRSVPANVNGRTYWNLTHKFLVRNNGIGLGGANPEDVSAGNNYVWNNYVTPGQWDLITSDGELTGQRIYQSGDLNELFDPANI